MSEGVRTLSVSGRDTSTGPRGVGKLSAETEKPHLQHLKTCPPENGGPSARTSNLDTVKRPSMSSVGASAVGSLSHRVMAIPAGVVTPCGGAVVQ